MRRFALRPFDGHFNLTMSFPPDLPIDDLPPLDDLLVSDELCEETFSTLREAFMTGVILANREHRRTDRPECTCGSGTEANHHQADCPTLTYLLTSHPHVRSPLE